jgi:hypothetical protein
VSNRRKSREERTNSPRYGVSKRRGRGLFNFRNFNFEVLKGGFLDELREEPETKDRSLTGKDRVRARRGKR